MESFAIMPTLEDRYSRHHLIDWWDQEKLKNARVLVAGVGALGNEVLKNLALLGIGHIAIIDFDTVSITNLTRSVLFRDTDIDLTKVEVARQRLLEINPELSILAIHGDLQFDLGVGDVRSYNLIIGCVDSINARWAINQIAYRAGIPWINGGIGVTDGEVSFFAPQTESACFECEISAQMWERRNQRYSCHGMKRELSEKNIPTTATLASMIGGMQVQQALMYLHERKGFLNPGEKVFISFNSWTNFKVAIQRRANCTAHDFSDIPIVNVSSDELTTHDICQELQERGFHNPVVWLRNEVLIKMSCMNQICNNIEDINRPVRQVPEVALICPKCGKERQTEIASKFSLKHHPNLLLEQLCLPKNEILFAEADNGNIAVQFC